MSSVSLFAAACWDTMALNSTRSLLLTALPTYSNSPTIPQDLLMHFSSRVGLVSVGCTICCLDP